MLQRPNPLLIRVTISAINILVGLSFCTDLCARQANSWKFFRGENFDGRSLETGVVDHWSSQGPPVLWIRDLGVGYSSFVGDDNRIFTQYQSLFGQYVVCLDARSGETIWEHRYACRRLSLAFEWSFLIGFPAALPFLWIVKTNFQRERKFTLTQWVFGALAFTAFYWTGAAIMLWKYSN